MIFPQFAIVNVEQLESGKSYNNRIYFVDIEPASPSPGLEDTPRSLVLKIAGHFFDHRKVENELGCLLLLKKYCPDVPVPEAIAWSANGQKIETVEGRSIEAAKDTPFSDHAWILTTRLSGRVLNVADLDSEHGGTILNQLGKFITMWRTRIPESPSWGNLRIKSGPEAAATLFRDLIPGKVFSIDASLLHSFSWPNTSPYYQISANDQLSRLKAEPQLKRNKSIFSTEWEAWIEHELPEYPLCQKGNHLLTHFDLAPRNILISEDGGGGPPRITGILDLEFTGFFPPEEEFLNATVRQDDDWEERHWNVLMREMARLGQKVAPVDGLGEGKYFDEKEWDQACTVVEVVDRIAPWEIIEGKYTEEELRRELDEAAETVRVGLEKLRRARKE